MIDKIKIKKFSAEFSQIDSEDTKGIIKFFRTFELIDGVVDIEELSIKVIIWGHYFLPRYFSSPTPEFHYDLVKRFFRPGNDYTAAPRGFAKTTIIQLCLCYSCANGLDNFIVIIEKSWNEASEVLDVLRTEFSDNEEILRVYGDLTKVNSKGESSQSVKNTAGDFVINGIRVRAKGFDSPIRGLKSGYSRPTRILLDDIESDEHIDNIDQRKKYLNNYTAGIIPAIDNNIGVIKMFGTILHDDSLLNTLIKAHKGKIYRAWNEKKELLWSSKWGLEKLERQRKAMNYGMGDAKFYQEYFNEPISEDDQIFRKEMFHYFNKLQLDKIKEKSYKTYTLVDPAISKRTTADFTAIVTVLVDELNRIFVLEITRERLDPRETIQGIFAHYTRWRPVFVGIETVAYQKALEYFLNEEKMKQDSFIKTMCVKEIKANTDKISKIKGGLQPFYSRGEIFHNSDDKNTSVLEHELIRFPMGVHDDVIDALAGIKDIIIPNNKVVEQEYNKFDKLRRSGASIAY